MSSIFRRIHFEPNISLAVQPRLDDFHRSALTSFKGYLDEEGIENHPMLMVQELVIEERTTLVAFPCYLNWKAASRFPEIKDNFKGALHVATIVFNENLDILWRKRSVKDAGGSWFLSSQALVLEGQYPSNVAGHALAKQVGIVARPEPVMIFISPDSLDLVVVYALQIENNSKLSPGKESEDLLWTPPESPPAGLTPIATEISAAFKQLYPELPRKIAIN